MKYLSLLFDEDLHRDDIDMLKTVKGCVGVSAYRNTVNLYFKRLDRSAILSLALLLERQLRTTGGDVALANSTIHNQDSATRIYTALREEAAV